MNVTDDAQGELLLQLPLGAQDELELQKYFVANRTRACERAAIEEEFRLQRLFAGRIVVLLRTAAGPRVVKAWDVDDPEIPGFIDKLQRSGQREQYSLQTVLPRDC